MAVYLNLKTNCLKTSAGSKKAVPANLTLNLYCTKQLSQKFLFDLNTLTKSIVFEIVGQQTDSSSHSLNCALAFFLHDSISILDRGLIFKQVDFYFRETNRGLTQLSNQIKNVSVKQHSKNTVFNSIRLLAALQLDFLRILSAHEHFLSLNLPIFPDLNELAHTLGSKSGQHPPKMIIESKEYFHRHYLAGLVLRSVFKSLHSPFSHIQSKSVELLRNLLESHDLDTRLSGANVRARIAYMYFPFVNLILHFIPLLIASMPCKSSFIQMSATHSDIKVAYIFI